jgi:hypothetical protein
MDAARLEFGADPDQGRVELGRDAQPGDRAGGQRGLRQSRWGQRGAAKLTAANAKPPEIRVRRCIILVSFPCRLVAPAAGRKGAISSTIARKRADHRHIVTGDRDRGGARSGLSSGAVAGD